MTKAILTRPSPHQPKATAIATCASVIAHRGAILGEPANGSFEFRLGSVPVNYDERTARDLGLDLC